MRCSRARRDPTRSGCSATITTTRVPIPSPHRVVVDASLPARSDEGDLELLRVGRADGAFDRHAEGRVVGVERGWLHRDAWVHGDARHALGMPLILNTQTGAFAGPSDVWTRLVEGLRRSRSGPCSRRTPPSPPAAVRDRRAPWRRRARLRPRWTRRPNPPCRARELRRTAAWARRPCRPGARPCRCRRQHPPSRRSGR